jgi:hypothetical protein
MQVEQVTHPPSVQHKVLLVETRVNLNQQDKVVAVVEH